MMINGTWYYAALIMSAQAWSHAHAKVATQFRITSSMGPDTVAYLGACHKQTGRVAYQALYTGPRSVLGRAGFCLQPVNHDPATMLVLIGRCGGDQHSPKADGARMYRLALLRVRAHLPVRVPSPQRQ